MQKLNELLTAKIAEGGVKSRIFTNVLILELSICMIFP